MFIPDPDFYPSRIPDPNTATKEKGKKIVVTFLCSHKFHKTENPFSFEMPKKKIWANFQRILSTFYPRNCSQKHGFRIRDPGSGKKLFRIPGPKRHRISDPDPQHCLWTVKIFLAQHKPEGRGSWVISVYLWYYLSPRRALARRWSRTCCLTARQRVFRLSVNRNSPGYSPSSFLHLTDNTRISFVLMIGAFRVMQLPVRSVPNPWHSSVDPDPRIHASD